MSKDSNADLHTAAARADAPPPGQCTREPRDPGDHRDPGDLTDMPHELRVFVPGLPARTGFLVGLPFERVFLDIARAATGVYRAACLYRRLSLLRRSPP